MLHQTLWRGRFSRSVTITLAILCSWRHRQLTSGESWANASLLFNKGQQILLLCHFLKVKLFLSSLYQWSFNYVQQWQSQAREKSHFWAILCVGSVKPKVMWGTQFNCRHCTVSEMLNWFPGQCSIILPACPTIVSSQSGQKLFLGDGTWYWIKELPLFSVTWLLAFWIG